MWCMKRNQKDNGMVKPMEQMNPMINSNNMNNGCSSKPGVEKRTTKGPQNNKAHALNCPRCNSTNTKFCYYNNYSLTQPRYFCKTCRRYWTEGGSLRNVPIGGGSRKNKRSITISSSSSAAPPAAATTIVTNASSFPDLSPPSLSLLSSHQNARTQDLNLGTYLGLSQFAQPGPEIGPNNGAAHHHHNGSTPSSSPSNANSSGLPAALELLRTGIASRGVNSFVPLQMPMMAPSHSVTYNNAGISFPGPTLNFNPMGINGGLHGVQENGTGRALFPFGELKQIPTSTGIDQVTKGQWNSNNGMLGGGSW